MTTTNGVKMYLYVTCLMLLYIVLKSRNIHIIIGIYMYYYLNMLLFEYIYYLNMFIILKIFDYVRVSTPVYFNCLCQDRSTCFWVGRSGSRLVA